MVSKQSFLKNAACLKPQAPSRGWAMAIQWLSIASMAVGLVACASNCQLQPRLQPPLQAPAEGGFQPLTLPTSSDEVASSATLMARLLNQQPNWLAAQFIDVDSFPETINAANRAMFDESGLVFSSVVPITYTTLYLYRVGVFEDKQAQQGRFLAIYDEAGRLLQVFEDRSDGAAFSVLRREPGRVLWVKCFECGEYDISKISSGFVRD